MSKKKVITQKGSYKRLFSYMKKYMIRLFLAVVFILLSTFAYSLAPLFMGKATDSLAGIFNGVNAAETAKSFIRFLVLMISAYAVNGILTYMATSLIVSVTENTIFDLRKNIDDKLSRLPLNYYDTHSYGDILSRVTNDVDTVSDSLQQSIYQVLNAIFTIGIVLAIMLSVSGVLTVVALAIVPVAVYFSAKIAKKSKMEFDIQQQKTGELNGYVEEYYSGHIVVSVFGKENDVIDEFEEINDDLFEASSKGQFLSGTLMPIMQNMTNFGYAMVCLVGAILAIMGGFSIGMIQTFTQYLRQFSQPITQVMQISGIIQTTGSAATRIFEFLDEEEEVPDAEDAKFPEKLSGQVQFDHIKFGYLPHRTLIHDLDFTVRAGEKTAIVGPTGAGKTTLINLIMRFYDVKGGAIRIDGVDIRDMERSRLREIFGMVLQDTWLYSGTIRENIRYGKLDATDEEVAEAAKKARADAFIRTLPRGYDFVLQEGASNIAQGQRQLLTIARAMLSNPPILILDEATSSVDTRTEVMIQEAMSAMMKGRTSFVIAHRLSTIKEKDGLYAKLYNSQFSEEE